MGEHRLGCTGVVFDFLLPIHISHPIAVGGRPSSCTNRQPKNYQP